MKKLSAIILICVLLLSFVGCFNNETTESTQPETESSLAEEGTIGNTPKESGSIGKPEDTFGGSLEDSGIYDGYFDDGETDLDIQCVSGTPHAYTFEENVLTFNDIGENSIYSISGKLSGNIIVNTGNTYDFELELNGVSIVSTLDNPIRIISGNNASVIAKKDSKNYIYDNREIVDEADTTLSRGAIYSVVDLKIGGKGNLAVVSKNNNGIHSKDDLEVKNLTLSVACNNNALKGNDSIEIINGNLNLIATEGDGLKTSNSDISTKGNQRGTIRITDSVLTIYAACDGIDASYDVIIEGAATDLKIYTDKYSNYSEEVTDNSESKYYVLSSNKDFKYSVKYSNSEEDVKWVNAEYDSTVSNGYSSYYYHSFSKLSEYTKMQLFVYSSSMEQGQAENYMLNTEVMTPNTANDTISISQKGSSYSYSWTNYSTTISNRPQGGFGGGPSGGPNGGPGGNFGGGMNEGNTSKGNHSTKGIKADNQINIGDGKVTVKSYDDAVHASNTAVLENGASPLGNITINGGNISLYSNDDGLHADGALSITGGDTEILNSYEGAEGTTISILGGRLLINSLDDGINATTASDTGVKLKGGYVYIYCQGDGIDTNSQTSYSGISFEGGDAVIISNSQGNSAIDTERGYKYTSGSIVAIMPSRGMTSEATKCSNFSTVGTTKNMSFSSGASLDITGDMTARITMPCSISDAYVIVLNKSISVTTNS